MDYITDNQYLTLRSRLRSFLDRLNQEENKIYESVGVDFPVRWMNLLNLLHLKASPMPVTAIAQQLNKSHPEIHTITKAMESAGYLSSVTDRRDKRKRKLSLTTKGQEMVTRLLPVWQATERATEQWIREKAPEFFLILRNLEYSLNTQSFHDRVMELWKGHQMAAINIDVLPPEEWPAVLNHYRHFSTLNLPVAEIEALLHDPKKYLINDGGQLFVYSRDGQHIGSVAVRRLSFDIAQILFIWVHPNHRRKQIGHRLLQQALQHARSIGCRQVIFHTSRFFVAAEYLFRSNQFVYTSKYKHSFPPPEPLHATMVVAL